MTANKPQSPPQKPVPKAGDVDGRLQLLLTLISLLKGARHKEKKSELEFMMVNQTYNLIPYRTCIYWVWDGHEAKVKVASGLVQVDENGAYALWLGKVLGGVVRKAESSVTKIKEGSNSDEKSYVKVVGITPAQCSDAEAKDWKQWAAAHAQCVIFRDTQDKISGGLWLDRDMPFNEVETAFLEDLSDNYAYALQQFDRGSAAGKEKIFKSIFGLSRGKIRLLVIISFFSMFIPVRMSATAPAEIVARAPYMVSVPFDGIIETIEVTPGQVVKKGDILVRMDSTMLKNKSEVMAREMETAVVAYTQTEREAFSDRAKLADINILKAQAEQKGAEKKFADDLLSKAEIRAERDGIVIFSDANALRGKPVQTGEQIMLLADPQDSELLIRVPVDAMIEIDESISARFFLNISPLGFKDARYQSIGYQATPDPDGLLTYKVRAKFDSNIGEENPRIGLTGTGKVYGKKTILVFNVLRRPLVTLRQKMGF